MRTLLLLSLSLMILACDSENQPQVDLQAPIIEILTDVANATIPSNRPIPVEVYIQENQSLHHYSIILRSADRSLIEVLASGHLHETDFHFIDTLHLPNQVQEYSLTVKASDHNDNQAHQQIRWWVE